jgi:hypothetical protein
MGEYWALLSALPGARETGCMDLSAEDSADWICDLRYSTRGHTPGEAVSQPVRINVNGCAAVEIHHALLPEGEPGELESLYEATSDSSVFAVVVHVSDYSAHPTLVARWFQMLEGGDQEGTRRMTVAGAVELQTEP